MSKKKSRNLLNGSVGSQLFSLTWPGIGGSLAITIFNLTDTFFVSRLGTDALAAMGFTFLISFICFLKVTYLKSGGISSLKLGI